MATPRLPIAGHPHLFLAKQDDNTLHARIISALRKAGFKVEAQRIVPPEGADGRQIISAITAAFQTAKAS